MKLSDVVTTVKTVVRNLPTIRKEIAAAATAGATMVGVLVVTFPNLSTAHLALAGTIATVLTGVATFLTNNKVATAIDDFAGRPVWQAKLVYLVKGGT